MAHLASCHLQARCSGIPQRQNQLTHRDCCCRAQTESQAAPEAQHRRSALLSGGLALLLAAGSRRAEARDLQYGTWDGSSAAYGSCAIGDEGTECRKAALRKEKLDLGSYGTSNFSRPAGSTAIEPTIKLGDEYSKATLALSADIQKWSVLDPFDATRPKVTQSLKKESADWASKYARGGSARKLSARRMYVAVDALQGHLVSQGMQVMPAPKLKVLLKDVDEAKELLAEAK